MPTDRVLEIICDDLLAENRELDRFVSAFPIKDFARVTPFFGWSVRSQILHLHQVDRFGLISLKSNDKFAEEVQIVWAAQAEGVELSQQIQREFEGVADEDVLRIWRETYEGMIAGFRGIDPKTRLTWFGPDMSLVSFATARQMEVWAHGQDIYDLFDVRRANTDRIRNICDIGVRTFGWSFRNRKLEMPASPSVTLTGPSGAIWKWEGDGNGSVTGPAVDFALVVTQRRSPSDTALLTEGDVAHHWLEIAQCFAGAPQEPASPGSRPAI
ncbi:TIGR03084 family protein [Sphingobium sp. AS12]|uniref:TIGR03084 family metal-binding protein n=1 Tax=Sphingobium sp. AS12 TaxID=2849495 RepID=UPI001C315E2E|nr:TIGR03084 family metal-binding protein [Sphingobium sp. AS12]MBV2149110.1 TIGR03084 family protein [Sphingobium sp. AS12]